MQGETLLEPVEQCILGILLGTAVRRGTILYTDIANLVGLNIGWQRDRARLGEYLGHVADYSLAEWGIVLPALAVGKGENMPSGRRGIHNNSSGFYGWCEANGLDTSDPAHLVIDQQRKVYDYFAS